MPAFLTRKSDVEVLYVLGKTFGRLPSEVIGIPRGTWPAYDFDVAVMMSGIDMEARMQKEAREKAKQAHGNPPQAPAPTSLGVGGLPGIPHKLPFIPQQE